MTAAAWLRAARLRFLASSVVAVSAGLALAAWRGAPLDAAGAAVTMGGVLALHASVDLLNDYWDHRRGIDAPGRSTGVSGGTGVLPEGLLEPRSVRRAGIALLAAGCAAGAYLAVQHGPAIAAMLAFAAASVWFYSTRAADAGLSEILVAAKGALIVVGSAYVQSPHVAADSVLAGAAVGALSAAVLYAASFPDREADAAGGRRTLANAAGPRRAAALFWAFPAAAYAALAAGAASGALPAWALLPALAAPLALAAGAALRRGAAAGGARGDALAVLAARRAVWFSRAAGSLLVAGLALAALGAPAPG